jgi:hypothetical protein
MSPKFSLDFPNGFDYTGSDLATPARRLGLIDFPAGKFTYKECFPMEARQHPTRLPRLSLLAGALALTLALLPQSALAGPAVADTLTFDINQVGGNVVVTGSGAVDIGALTANGTAAGGGYMNPFFGDLGVGSIVTENDETITGLAGPSGFGTLGPQENSNSDTGTSFDFNYANDKFDLPANYAGGSLSGTATYNSTTIGGLGLTPGIYTWTYGSSSQDSVIVDVAPEPSSWLLLATGFALLVAFGRRRFALN